MLPPRTMRMSASPDFVFAKPLRCRTMRFGAILSSRNKLTGTGLHAGSVRRQSHAISRRRTPYRQPCGPRDRRVPLAGQVLRLREHLRASGRAGLRRHYDAQGRGRDRPRPQLAGAEIFKRGNSFCLPLARLRIRPQDRRMRRRSQPETEKLRSGPGAGRTSMSSQAEAIVPDRAAAERHRHSGHACEIRAALRRTRGGARWRHCQHSRPTLRRQRK